MQVTGYNIRIRFQKVCKVLYRMVEKINRHGMIEIAYMLCQVEVLVPNNPGAVLQITATGQDAFSGRKW